MKFLTKSAILDNREISWGLFFHRLGIAVSAEPWELKNRPMRQLWRNGRLRVKLLEKGLLIKAFIQKTPQDVNLLSLKNILQKSPIRIIEGQIDSQFLCKTYNFSPEIVLFSILSFIDKAFLTICISTYFWRKWVKFWLFRSHVRSWKMRRLFRAAFRSQKGTILCRTRSHQKFKKLKPRKPRTH